MSAGRLAEDPINLKILYFDHRAIAVVMAHRARFPDRRNATSFGAPVLSKWRGKRLKEIEIIKNLDIPIGCCRIEKVSNALARETKRQRIVTQPTC
jgi:hypothetical protein